MKQVKILWLVAALFCATTAFGKDIKTVVFKTTPKCIAIIARRRSRTISALRKGWRRLWPTSAIKRLPWNTMPIRRLSKLLLKGLPKSSIRQSLWQRKKRAEKVLVQKRLLAQRKRKSAVLLPSKVPEIIRSMIRVFVLCVVDSFCLFKGRRDNRQRGLYYALENL